MNISFIDNLIHYNVHEIDAFYKETPDAVEEFTVQQNRLNLRNAIVFIWIVIISQMIVGIGRLVGEWGFPYYNTALIGLCFLLLWLIRVPFFIKNITNVALILFCSWAITFPFFIIRLGGYNAPTYPIYWLMIVYILVFFYFSIKHYLLLFGIIFLSNISIFFLHADFSLDEFLYRQVVMLLFVSVGIAGSYINVHLRKKDFYNQFVLKSQKQQLQTAYKQLEEKELQLIQSEKMASLGKMTAGLAHEINNPLGFIHGNLQTINDYLNDIKKLLELYERPGSRNEIEEFKKSIQYDFLLDDLHKTVESCERGSSRIATIVNNLKSFSRLDEAEQKKANVADCVESALNQALSKDAGIKISRNFDKLPEIECYPSQLNQAFFALIQNAVDAIGSAENGQIILKGSLDKDRLVIEISDNGFGIPDGIREKIFDPFFTTKSVGKGTGLGLSMAYGIIQRHQGQIHFTSVTGKGTSFFVELPV
ncbi:HAMP domain-containing histidine kinase [bacterium]|nr:HAMP domain-containing histidine kinase [bacterium]